MKFKFLNSVFLWTTINSGKQWWPYNTYTLMHLSVYSSKCWNPPSRTKQVFRDHSTAEVLRKNSLSFIIMTVLTILSIIQALINKSKWFKNYSESFVLFLALTSAWFLSSCLCNTHKLLAFKGLLRVYLLQRLIYNQNIFTLIKKINWFNDRLTDW